MLKHYAADPPLRSLPVKDTNLNISLVRSAGGPLNWHLGIQPSSVISTSYLC